MFAGLRLQDLCVARFPAAQEKFDKLGEFAGRSLQITRGTQIDVRIAEGPGWISIVSGGQERLVPIGEREVGIGHAQRTKNGLANVLIIRLAGDFLDEIARDAEARIGIRHPGARRPANILRFLEALKDFEKRKIIRVLEVIDFGCLHVVESRSVFEQIEDAHGIAGLPAVFEGDFRSNIFQARLEIDFSFFLELQKCQGDKGLADRADAKFRFTSDLAARAGVRFSESAAPQRHAGTRQVSFVENILHRFLQFQKRFWMRPVFFLLATGQGC